MSRIPPAAKTSASPTVPTVMPTAPAATCIRASSTLLWVFACGRSAIPRARIGVGHRGDVGFDHVQVHHDRGRIH